MCTTYSQLHMICAAYAADCSLGFFWGWARETFRPPFSWTVPTYIWNMMTWIRFYAWTWVCLKIGHPKIQWMMIIIPKKVAIHWRVPPLYTYPPTPAMSRGSVSEKQCSSGTALAATCWCQFLCPSRTCSLTRWAWNFHVSRVQNVTLDTAVCGLEGPVKRSAGCCFPVSEGFDIDHLWPVGASSFAPLGHACWAWNFPFCRVQKVTLDTAVCGLERPVQRSAGCCFPVSEGFRRSTGLLVPVPLVSTWPLSEGQPRAWKPHPCSFHPWPQLHLPRSWPACCLSACWAWNCHFPTVQKMTLDSAVSSGGQPAEKPKGLKNTPPLPQFAAPAFATFLACLLSKPLPFPPTSVATWCFYASSFG